MNEIKIHPLFVRPRSILLNQSDSHGKSFAVVSLLTLGLGPHPHYKLCLSTFLTIIPLCDVVEKSASQVTPGHRSADGIPSAKR